MQFSGGGHRPYVPMRLKDMLKDMPDEDLGEIEWTDERPIGDKMTWMERDIKTLKRVRGSKKQEPLTIEQIAAVCGELNRTLVPYALIGGAAFKMWELPYETPDVDVAAFERIEGFGFETLSGPGVGTDPNGHYLIKAIKVDWMYRLKDGSGRLFKRAITKSVKINGLPVATIEDAMAIKVNAGRQKDVAVFYEFIRQGWVDAKIVLDIIDQYVDKTNEE